LKRRNNLRRQKEREQMAKTIEFIKNSILFLFIFSLGHIFWINYGASKFSTKVEK